jgi:protein SCO1/2
MPIGRYSPIALCVLLAGWALQAWSHDSAGEERLPIVGTAPAFALTDQFGNRITLADLRGNVLAVTFIYAACTDSCPLVTAKMVVIQRKLGAEFGQRIRFISITVDPEYDTPAVLRDYAAAHGADVAGWSFLTGSVPEIQEVVERYGAFAKRVKSREVEHLFLTSLIDRRGMLRVQYLGYRFDPDEMLEDLHALLRE